MSESLPGIEDALFARARLGRYFTNERCRQCNEFFGPRYRFDWRREEEFRKMHLHDYGDNLQRRYDMEYGQ